MPPVTPPPGITLRPTDAAEFAAFHRVTEAAFGSDSRPEDVEADNRVFEHPRSTAALDGDQIVATAGIFSFEMTVPGGQLPVAGVTFVGVAPTHRRRGILSAIMDGQLAALHDDGEAVAALWASEAAIYARFGYGLASRRLEVVVHRGEGQFRPDVATGQGTLELRPPEDAIAEMASVYATEQPHRVGHVVRSEQWWRRRLYDPEHARRGGAAQLCVLSRDAGGTPDGYALYRTRGGDWADGLPNGEAAVGELVATTPATRARLWRYLLDLDLMGRMRAWNLPLDEPLLHMLADPRRARSRVGDALWVRLADVDRALAGRRYAAEIDVVLEVHDPRCPWNAGRRRLRGGPGGAACEPTRNRADLALPIEALGAAYLGGSTLVAQARAGLVTEHRAGALAVASAAFQGLEEPFIPEVF